MKKGIAILCSLSLMLTTLTFVQAEVLPDTHEHMVGTRF